MSGVIDDPRLNDATDQPSAKPAAISLLQQIAAERDRRYREGEHITLPVPTWRDERGRPTLYARYRVLKDEEFDEGAKNASDDATEANADFLIKACIGLFVPDEDGNPIALEDNGRPVGYGEEVCEMLGVTVTRAREAVFYLFKDNGLSIRDHADDVVQWMRDTSRAIEGALLGESKPGRR